MDVATCRNCGKIFNHIRGQLLCPACQKELDSKFKAVKKYVYDHPMCSIPEVSKEMSVSVAQINRWIREERLCFADSSNIGISCESCGASIKTGRYCDKCKAQLASGLASAAGLNRKPVQQEHKRPTAETKMRFLQ